MKDHQGNELSELDIIKGALEHLAEAVGHLYETTSPEGHALAAMAEAALKYGTVISRGDDVLTAIADMTAYEAKVFEEKEASREVSL